MRASLRRHPGRLAAGAAAAALLALLAAGALRHAQADRGAPQPPPARNWKARLKAYPTSHYVIYTDLDIETVREAAARLTAMTREYELRARSFGRKAHGRLPFYLFSRAEDYYAAGGLRGSSGVYTGRYLAAIADKRRGESVWRVVQHEGFHQYVHKVIGQRIPVWVNEGMAEYFAEGLWTGDRFVVGVIPPRRLAALKALIKAGKLLPFFRIMAMDHKQWAADLSARNYHQAWAMVHFLAHADDAKYRAAFDGFIADIAIRNMAWERAFLGRFGRDLAGFERRFVQWWTSLPEAPSAETYLMADVQTVTTFFARAYSQGQRFETMAEFFAAARKGETRQSPRQWLPRKLLLKAMDAVEKLHEWRIDTSGRLPRVVLALPDGRTITGSFTVGPGLAGEITTTITRPQGPPAATRPAAPAPAARP
jgi:hypothetical protein